MNAKIRYKALAFKYWLRDWMIDLKYFGLTVATVYYAFLSGAIFLYLWINIHIFWGLASVAVFLAYALWVDWIRYKRNREQKVLYDGYIDHREERPI